MAGDDFERPISIFGVLRLERRTDLIAFVAFLLSVSAIAWDVVAYFNRIDVDMTMPQQAVLDSYVDDRGRRYVALGLTKLHHFNRGSPNHAVILTRITAEMRVLDANADPVSDRTLRFIWHEDSFYDRASAKDVGLPEGVRAGELFRTVVRDAEPHVVKGGDVFTHEPYMTPFAPCEGGACDYGGWMSTSDFVPLLKKAAFVRIEVSAEYLDTRARLDFRCIVRERDVEEYLPNPARAFDHLSNLHCEALPRGGWWPW